MSDKKFEQAQDWNDLRNSSVAIIDDVVDNIKLLNSMLKDSGYYPYVFHSGQEALQSLELSPPDIVLLDINMPHMDGFEVARRMKKIPGLRSTPIIFVTALDDVTSKVKAFQSGGVDFITKPYVFEEVRSRVETHLRIAKMQRYTNEYNAYLKAQLEKEYQRTIETQEQLIALHKNNFNAQMAVIEIVTGIVEVSVGQLGRSTKRVQHLCGKITNQLTKKRLFSDEITPTFLPDIIYASALYDCGMASLPPRLVNSKLKYSSIDRREMEKHTAVGASILWRAREKFPQSSMLKMAVELAATHHERYDGSGYPDGIEGDRIPLSSRILSIADVYDALISDSQYRVQYSVKSALSTISNRWAKQFDPVILDAFMAAVDVDEDEKIIRNNKITRSK